ncbi:hypothetical protein AURDEDRAFT_142097 [Auricularia subglabra TFB-10046 SS5]|nr:hypothetical protein AURDEDRAFT_142097 [Auricularia subglabra TFB-10046 SS5]
MLLSAKLRDLRLSPDTKSFASGGEEVELSVWDLERSFTAEDAPPRSALKKRKQDELLHPAETWRAKNVPYDSLNLRVPVQISSLTFLGNDHELLTGTSFGAVRRYDTRAARKPVANWTNVIAKEGSIRRVERGVSEHDVFVSDERGQLFALDIRNGKQLYSYKGIGGTVSSFAMDGTQHILSASMDHYARLHSTAAPPATAGRNLDARGDTLVKFYTQDFITAVTAASPGTPAGGSKEDEEVGDEIWEQLPDVDDDEEQTPPRRKRRKV